jgi:type II secretory pathway pseudopilin PulG
MGASASLSQLAVSVEPGQQATCEIKVRNTGQVVDEFTIDVVGVAEGWTEAEPAVLRLFPGAEDTARITFKPPRVHSVPAGPHPFGVRVISKEDGPGSTVEEGVVDVGKFVDVATELVPKTSRGRRRGYHDLAIDNRGNGRLEGEVTVVDPDGLLKYEVVPPVISGDPGTATFLKVRLKPKKTFWRGPNKTIPFQTVLTAEGLEPAYADGAYVQESLIPPWLIKALLALLALLILLVILWYTLFKPVVNSAAKDAVSNDLDQTQQAAAQAQQAATAAQQTANQANATASSVAAVVNPNAPTTAGNGGTTATTSGTNPAGGVGNQGVLSLGPELDFRIAANTPPAPAGTFKTFTSTAQPADKKYMVTDIVFQNPASDSGTLQVRRGSDVLLSIGLQNFRDLDYHFIAPIVFAAGQPVTLAVECLNATASCTPAAYFAGVLPAS